MLRRALVVALIVAAAPPLLAQVSVQSTLRPGFAVPGSITGGFTYTNGLSSATNALAERGTASVGSIDLAGGFMKAFATAPEPSSVDAIEQYSQAQTEITAYDSLTFAGSVPFSGALQVTFRGTAIAS